MSVNKPDSQSLLSHISTHFSSPLKCFLYPLNPEKMGARDNLGPIKSMACGYHFITLWQINEETMKAETLFPWAHQNHCR